MRELLERFTFLKYLIAGGVGGVLHLFLLYLFTDIFGVHYLISTTLALFIVFWVSFTLQKYWTFREVSSDRFKGQAVIYLVMHSISFASNALLMYVLVDLFGVWYMAAQVIVSLSIACVTYIINKRVIFKQQ